MHLGFFVAMLAPAAWLFVLGGDLIRIIETRSGKRYIVEIQRGRQIYKPVDAKTTLSVAEVARHLQCSPQFIYQVFTNGKLPYIRHRTGYRVKLDDLIAFQEHHFKRRVKTMGYRTRQELLDENEELKDRIEELEAELEDEESDDDSADDDEEGDWGEEEDPEDLDNDPDEGEDEEEDD